MEMCGRSFDRFYRDNESGLPKYHTPVRNASLLLTCFPSHLRTKCTYQLTCHDNQEEIERKKKTLVTINFEDLRLIAASFDSTLYSRSTRKVLYFFRGQTEDRKFPASGTWKRVSVRKSRRCAAVTMRELRSISCHCLSYFQSISHEARWDGLLSSSVRIHRSRRTNSVLAQASIFRSKYSFLSHLSLIFARKTNISSNFLQRIIFKMKTYQFAKTNASFYFYALAKQDLKKPLVKNILNVNKQNFINTLRKSHALSRYRSRAFCKQSAFFRRYISAKI